MPKMNDSAEARQEAVALITRAGVAPHDAESIVALVSAVGYRDVQRTIQGQQVTLRQVVMVGPWETVEP